MSVTDPYYPLIITFLVLNILVVGLRVYTRVWTQSLGYDDALILLSLASFIVFGVFELQAVYYGLAATDVKPQYDALKSAMYFTVAQLLYIISSGITKLAVCAVLFRLTSRSDMMFVRYSLIFMAVTVIIFTFVVGLIFGLQCQPLSVAWGVGTGTCMNTSIIGRAGLALSIEDVFVSWGTAILPVYMLWETQIPVKVKATAMILLGFGAVGSVATIVRLRYVIIIQGMSGTSGLATAAIYTIQATVYSILEVALSIFAASLSALRPLLRKMKIFESTNIGDSNNGTYNMHTYDKTITCTTSRAVKLDNDIDADSERGIWTSGDSAKYQVHVTA